ncbi:serpin family protein [Endozoicomonas sp. ONNA2]|uniref:serpin family protein n=1 Tax=Endozoicomonas sp. ONNA2 TaxID=2828741 RepID=UPI0021491D05|nr:serpin family protein [Endozoicomonas sp. ONNA2]
MNFHPAFSPAAQYLPPTASASAQPLTDSSYSKVFHSLHESSLVESSLESDVKRFMEIAKKKLNDRNIVVSPYLISKTDKVSIDLLGLLQRGQSDISDKPDNPAVHSSLAKLHFFSKNTSIDTTLEQLGVPCTSSRQLDQQGYDNVTQRLNEQIAKDTNGVITNLLNPGVLKDPNTAFLLVSWLFQQVSWEQPFMVKPQIYSTNMTWDGNKQPEIVWMESGKGTNLIAYKNISDFEFIALPVKESGLNAVFIMPPKAAQQEHSDRVSHILTKGLISLFERECVQGHVALHLPKYQFDYVYEEDYPELLGSGKHRANLSINEAGAHVAAAFALLGGGMPEELQINRPFYFFMIYGQGEESSLVGAAYIKQPWG